MELLQLRYFCDAAQSENFSATAKKFMVPPSAVSQSIKRLENELTVSLFLRRANRIRLNESGKLFYDKAKAALKLLEEGKDILSDTAGHGRIRLSIFINRHLVMETVEQFSRLHPGVDIVTKYTVPPSKESFDLIVTDEIPDADYVHEELLSEDILLALRADHPLAKYEQITAKELSETPFITTNQGSSLHHITLDVCRKIGFSPRIVIHSDDPYYIRKCIELGLGVSFVPAVSWQGQFSENVVLKRVGEYRRTTYLWHKEGEHFLQCVTRFAEMLSEKCRKAQMGEKPHNGIEKSTF